MKKAIRLIGALVACGLCTLASGQQSMRQFYSLPGQAVLATAYTQGDAARDAAAARNTQDQANSAAQPVASPLQVQSHGQRAIASGLRVHTGFIQCELGVGLQLEEDAGRLGMFKMQIGRTIFAMRSVPTTTGAVRLEDDEGGMVWIQVANKSMLLDQRAGTRLADGCVTPAQVAQAQRLTSHSGSSLLGDLGD